MNWRRNRQRPHPGDTANARFERAVQQSFAFLVRHYGFRRDACRTRGSEAWIVYAKREARIIVSREHASGCKVTLGERTLDELAQELARAGRYTPKPSAALTLEESVAHCADVLLAIGAEPGRTRCYRASIRRHTHGHRRRPGLAVR